MNRLSIFVFCIVITTSLSDVAIAQEFPVLKGDYLGQTPPNDTPKVFARGIVSDNYQQHGATRFSPDGNEVFWQTNKRPGPENKEWISNAKTMKRIGDIWTEPSLVPYTNAIFSTDGKRLYVGSSKEGDDPYFVEKQGNSWSKPKKVNIVTNFPEIRFVYFPSIASNGTLYFMGYASGLWINIGMYRTELKNGEYTKPELLPSSINLPGNIRNWTPFIAPDESYLIFCSTRGLPKSDQGDLFICFRLPDSNWTEPISMGEPINTNQLERFPAVSPDGMYLFFTRDSQEYDEDVYWVSSRIIDKLKAKAILEHRVKQ